MAQKTNAQQQLRWATVWPQDPSSRLATTDMGRKFGAVPLWGRESWVSIYNNMARVEVYLRIKFHFDPSNRLATIHQRYRQTDRQTDRQTMVS